MPRKKIKLITLDLDDTVWPNHKVILDAEKTLWTYVKNKTTSLDEGFGEKEINKINTRIKISTFQTTPCFIETIIS